MKLPLTIALSTLVLSAPALADTIPKGARLSIWQPVGNGDPNGFSCHVGREIPPYRFVKCHRNFVWARINARFYGDPGSDLGIPTGAMSPGAAGGAVSGRN